MSDKIITNLRAAVEAHARRHGGAPFDLDRNPELVAAIVAALDTDAAARTEAARIEAARVAEELAAIDKASNDLWRRTCAIGNRRAMATGVANMVRRVARSLDAGEDTGRADVARVLLSALTGVIGTVEDAATRSALELELARAGLSITTNRK